MSSESYQSLLIVLGAVIFFTCINFGEMRAWEALLCAIGVPILLADLL